MIRRKKFSVAVITMVLGLISAPCIAQPAIAGNPSWPMFKGNPARTGYNPSENIINPTNAQNLVLSWVGIMGDLVDFSSPAVVNSVVYVGSFNGKLYAFDANGCGHSSCKAL
jgi:hypothetical protein